MRALKVVGLGGLLAVLAFLGVGLALPNNWRVERSIVMRAPPEAIHKRLANLRGWRDWAAFDIDPLAQWQYGGPFEKAGEVELGQPGAWMAWQGPQVGHGRLTIDESDPQTKIVASEAIESDTVNARATWTFEKQKDGTELTWVDEGTSPPIIGGYMKGLLEDMLAHNMQTGLARLQKLVEADGKKP